jgi:hypothetical protein
MSETQHAEDLEDKLVHVSTGGTEGGHCLNRHLGRSVNSCSHQWQAYKRMLDDDSDLYNNKCGKVELGSHVKWRKAEKGQSSVYWATLRRQPQDPEWNVGYKNNFNTHCNVPYYHEAHHIIPNSTLRTAILETFKPNATQVPWFRKQLVNEGYNLNHKSNMIMLPLEKKIGKALELPCHRDPYTPSHEVYSTQVKDKVKSILQSNKKAVAEHKKADYTACKGRLTTLSDELYQSILAAGLSGQSATLDEMVITDDE